MADSNAYVCHDNAYMCHDNAYMCHDNAKETSHLKQKSSDSIKTDNCIQFTKMPKGNKKDTRG